MYGLDVLFPRGLIRVLPMGSGGFLFVIVILKCGECCSINLKITNKGD